MNTEAGILELDKIMTPVKDINYRQFKKGILLENGYAMNETAAYIFFQCTGTRNLKEIMANYALNYAVDESIAAEDVHNIVKELVDLKILAG